MTKKQAESTAVAKKNPIELLVREREDRFRGALQNTDVGFDGFLMAVLADTVKSPQLREAAISAPETVIECLSAAADCGLLPGAAHDQFYLIPRWDGKTNRRVCTYITGYKGLSTMAYRHPRVRQVEARLVFEDEDFRYDQGSATLHHPYTWDVERSWDTLVGGYVYCVLEGSERPLVLPMSRKEIEMRRNRSSAYQQAVKKGRTDTPWITDPLAMARKSVLRGALESGMIPRSTKVDMLLRGETDQDREEIRAVQASVSEPDARPGESKVERMARQQAIRVDDDDEGGGPPPDPTSVVHDPDSDDPYVMTPDGDPIHRSMVSEEEWARLVNLAKESNGDKSD